MIRLFFAFTLVFANVIALGQVSISGGTGILNGLGTGYKPLGLHLGLELPRSSDLTFYVRASA
ncbi:MAG: hypothetical protein EBS17_04605, partial [Flavobacteriia bacterium]|nr:hypothetical protein [Flavobacteriia bacterium]